MRRDPYRPPPVGGSRVLCLGLGPPVTVFGSRLLAPPGCPHQAGRRARVSLGHPGMGLATRLTESCSRAGGGGPQGVQSRRCLVLMGPLRPGWLFWALWRLFCRRPQPLPWKPAFAHRELLRSLETQQLRMQRGPPLCAWAGRFRSTLYSGEKEPGTAAQKTAGTLGSVVLCPLLLTAGFPTFKLLSLSRRPRWGHPRD